MQVTTLTREVTPVAQRARLTEGSAMRWYDKPFPDCCNHCSSHRLSSGSCGHSQRELLAYYFAVYPDVSCPVFGDPDIEPCEQRPLATAIAEGFRYEERFIDEFDIDPRLLLIEGD